MNATAAEPRKASLTNSTFAEIAEVLRSHESFVVLSHVRPDGDALGSQIALGLALRKLGQESEGLERRGTAGEVFLSSRRRVGLRPA